MDSGRKVQFDFCIDLRLHEFRPEDSGPALTDLGLEIQYKESLKDVAGQKGDQQKALDGVGIVLIDVVGMPAVDQIVEPVILYIPALVAESDGPLRGNCMN